MGAYLRRQVVVVVAIYALVATAWIAASDRLLGALVSDPKLLVQVSVFKGAAFVAVTASLLIVLLRRRAAIIETAFATIEREKGERLAKAAEAEKGRRFADALIESLPGLFFLHDDGLRLRRWNQNLEKVTGRTADELAGAHAADLFSPSDRQRVLEDGSAPFEASLLAKDGSGSPYLLTRRQIDLGDGPSVICMCVDLAERKRAEALERERESDRLKSAFLATMSHEIRTPLNSIIGYSDLLLEGMAGPVSAEQTRQLGLVKASAWHLLDLINDVLDISKLDAGQLQVRCVRFDIRMAVERVSTAITPLAGKKSLVVNLSLPEAPCSVDSDQRRVEQILLNLLNNAVKFTDRGEVDVRVELEATAVRVRVKDTGIGIKEEHLPLLFQPFRQIEHGPARLSEGTGLGLAISRKLAELLGGTIAVESTWGSGSTFTLTLPAPR